MNDASTPPVDILIVGSGPTGLVLALWLTRLNVRVRIIDKVAHAGTTSRALAVQARTLEFYRQIGLADAVVERGRKVLAANLWVTGRKVARAVFNDMGAGVSRYPYAHIFPQDEHEPLLIEHLAIAGVQVERGVELLDFEETGGRVRARLKQADGSVESCDAAYLAGCDGAHSRVREVLNITFPGGTYAHLFYVADVEAAGPTMNGELHVGLDRTDFLAVFPLKDDRRTRLVGTVREEAHRPGHDLSWSDVSSRVIDWMRLDITRVNWFSTYRVHHRVASHFREGRAFLLGDAAHVHSPVGGQGMNTGIGDAVNLAWKVAAVLQGRADPSLVDSYEPERIAFARRLVATTDQAFSGVTSHGRLARLIRLRIVPLLFPLITRLRVLRSLMFRTVSQTGVNYRGSALSEGRVGEVQSGNRLPWVPAELTRAGDDNFAPLASLDWQLHVYGDATPALVAMCEARHLPLHVFTWHPEMRRVGLERDAVYLVRPDGYIAVAAAKGSVTAVTSYLDRRTIMLDPESQVSRVGFDRRPGKTATVGGAQ